MFMLTLIPSVSAALEPFYLINESCDSDFGVFKKSVVSPEVSTAISVTDGEVYFNKTVSTGTKEISLSTDLTGDAIGENKGIVDEGLLYLDFKVRLDLDEEEVATYTNKNETADVFNLQFNL